MPNRPAARGQEGFALIEVMVSALIAVMVTGAVIGLLNATGRAAAEQRHRTQAYAVAQDDIARMRAMRIPALNSYKGTDTVVLNGTTYTITSTANFVNDVSGEASCTTGKVSADYVKIRSSVSWNSIGTRPPAVIESIVAPLSGSLDATHGGITVSATNSAGLPLAGLGITGTGPATFSGTTDSNGCATFADLPAGSYTVTPSAGAGYVDKDGNAPAAKTVTVAARSTIEVPFKYDKGGTVNVNFRVRNYSGTVVNSKADSIIAFNAGMSTAETFGTPGGTETESIAATPLFPFTSPDSFYAGSCTTNAPTEGGASVNVPAGGSTTATVQLPALYLTVKNSSGTGISGAKVTPYDLECKSGGTNVKRTYFTNSSGQLNDPGFPAASYYICASASISGTNRLATVSSVSVRSLAGTTLNMSITSSSTAGTCP